MTSGADLFVVCKQCGSEVSPYITECPYCGTGCAAARPSCRARASPARARAGAAPGPRARHAAVPRRARGGAPRRRGYGSGRLGDDAPVRRRSRSCWPAAGRGSLWRAGRRSACKLVVVGPLHGDWWKLFTSQFVYLNGLYAFVDADRDRDLRLAAGAAATGRSLVLALFFGGRRRRRAGRARRLPGADRHRRQRRRARAAGGVGRAGPARGARRRLLRGRPARRRALAALLLALPFAIQPLRAGGP